MYLPSTQQCFIHTTCFDPNGSSSGAFRYTSLVIELQRNILLFTFTYIGHNRSLSRSSFTPLWMSLNDKVDIDFILLYHT
jgi:hypothetical protein